MDMLKTSAFTQEISRGIELKALRRCILNRGGRLFKFDCIWASMRGFANNTGADQPAHPCSLVNAFVICFLEIIICKLAASEVSIF